MGVFVGTENFWGTQILALPFAGCVVPGKGLTLSGSSFLICKMSLGLAPEGERSDFYYLMQSQGLGIC